MAEPQEALNQIDPELKKAHEFYIKAKVYRIIAIFLAVTGFIITAIFFNQLPADKTTNLMQNPTTMFVLLTPFLPAVVIQMMASSKRKKAMKLVQKKKGDLQSPQE